MAPSWILNNCKFAQQNMIRKRQPDGTIGPPEPAQKQMPKFEQNTPVFCGSGYVGRVWEDNGPPAPVSVFVYLSPTNDKTTQMKFPRDQVEPLTPELIGLTEKTKGTIRGMRNLGTRKDEIFTYLSFNHDNGIITVSAEDGRKMFPSIDKFVPIG